MRSTATTRALVARALGVAAVVIVVTAPMAAAHVEPDPEEAPKGGEATVTFRVPNEEEDASTIQVEINFPTDTPIASVAVEPVPGWRYETQTARLDEPIEAEEGQVTEAVTKVTWSGGEIRPGELQEFTVSLGPLPTDVDQVVFPTLQTYNNGDVARWIDQPTEGGEAEGNPAPALTLVEPGAAGSDEGAADDTGGGDSNVATDDDVSGATTLAVVGIVVGAIGLAVALFTLVTTRRRGGPSGDGALTAGKPSNAAPAEGASDEGAPSEDARTVESS